MYPGKYNLSMKVTTVVILNNLNPLNIYLINNVEDIVVSSVVFNSENVLQYFMRKSF